MTIRRSIRLRPETDLDNAGTQLLALWAE